MSISTKIPANSIQQFSNPISHTMLALSPPLFSTIGWPLEDHSISQDHNNYYSAESSLLHFPTTLQPQFDQLDHSTPSTAVSGESNISSMVKKLNHNASERDRRKKINNLYSSLRSLVPADHAKRLSIPATVSRVLKYIPELQQQVEGLIQKRDELLSKMSKQENVILQEEKQLQSTARRSGSSLSAVSTSRLSDTEVAIQISTVKSTHNIISRILQSLEEDGLEILNASTFESSGGRVFYNLQLQVDMFYRLECENLSQKLMSYLWGELRGEVDKASGDLEEGGNGVVEYWPEVFLALEYVVEAVVANLVYGGEVDEGLVADVVAMWRWRRSREIERERERERESKESRC
ncbi:hypothetical protein ACLB2K_016650 [Fragaria x ananassa]